MIRQYVRGDIEEIEFTTLHQIQQIFKQFRLLVNQLEHEMSTDEKRKETPAVEVGNQVGELDAQGGMSIGSAPANSRPADSSPFKPNIQEPSPAMRPEPMAVQPP